MKKLSIIAFLLALTVSFVYAQFDGTPATPQPFQTHPDYAQFDVQVHSRNQDTWADNALENDYGGTMTADHGTDCAAPPATHPTGSYAGAVFICNNHIMTAIAEGGYGEIALTPAQMLDFSQGPGVVQWEMSTQRDSLRDWPEIWIEPWTTQLTLPATIGAVDFNGPPTQGIQVTLQDNQGTWALAMMGDYVSEHLGGYINNVLVANPISWGIDPSVNQAATRQTFRLTVSHNHMRMERLASASAVADVYYDGDMYGVDTGFTQGVVQFTHHSYNPTKDGAGIPATWHWDNMIVTPAQAFTIIKTPTRALFTDGGIVFNAPAPANSWLRFSAVGAVQFSVDGGATWTLANPQVYNGAFGAAASYFVPIAAGSQAVMFRFSPSPNGYTGPFIAQDFSIFSLGGVAPTPTPGGSTPTPVPPTATPAATATPAPTATPGAHGTVGITSIGPTTDSHDQNVLNGSRVTAPANIVLTSLSVYVGAVDSKQNNRQYQLAVYADLNGTPTQLIASTAIGTLTANSWNMLPVSASLQAGQSYWLIYNTNGSSNNVNNLKLNNTGTGAYSSVAVPFGSWPTSFPSPTLGTWGFSIYGSY